jgi:hypothetical protein
LVNGGKLQKKDLACIIDCPCPLLLLDPWYFDRGDSAIIMRVPGTSRTAAIFWVQRGGGIQNGLDRIQTQARPLFRTKFERAGDDFELARGGRQVRPTAEPGVHDALIADLTIPCPEEMLSR